MLYFLVFAYLTFYYSIINKKTAKLIILLINNFKSIILLPVNSYSNQ